MTFSCVAGFVIFSVVSVAAASQLKYHQVEDGLIDVNYVIRSWHAPTKPLLEYLSVSSFSWSDCGSPGDLAKVSALSISPDPLDVPGNVSVSFSGSLAKDLSAPLYLSVDIKKKVLFWVPVPCVDDIGSCDYEDICPLLAQITCPEPFQKHGIPCQCPVKAGQYSLPTSKIEVNPFGIPTWLEGGDYKVTATLKQEQVQVMCMFVEFSLK